MRIEELQLPNGYVVTAVAGSEAMIHEIWTQEFYARDFPLRPGMTVMDLGANQGFFSLQAAYGGARVLSYEPMPESYRLLCDNVARNGLAERIVAYNEALGARDEEREIFDPQSPLLAPTGLVTFHRDVLSMLDELVAPSTRAERVRCVTLKTALDREGTERLDLLKVDCEGSEVEILRSAPPEYFRRIDALVMETHDAYPERELYELVQDLGFLVHHYRKRGGTFRTGYLFASKDTRREARRRPVTILRAPAFVSRGEQVLLDGRDSFAARRAAALRRTWTLDGVELRDDGGDTVERSFSEPGIHHVSLSVADGDESDEESAEVLCLSSDYFSQPVDCVLNNTRMKGDQEFKYRVRPEGNKVLKIPFRSLPSFWTAPTVQIAVSQVTEGRVAGHYSFNGATRELAGPYSQFCIDSVPHGLDIVISLSAPAPLEFDVYWWLGPASVDAAPSPSADRTTLAPFGQMKRVIHDGLCTYLVTRSMLPDGWQPRQAVLGISVGDGRRGALSGFASAGGNVVSLKDWYTEIRFPIPHGDEPLEVEIDTIGARRELALAWWAEA